MTRFLILVSMVATLALALVASTTAATTRRAPVCAIQQTADFLVLTCSHLENGAVYGSTGVFVRDGDQSTVRIGTSDSTVQGRQVRFFMAQASFGQPGVLVWWVHASGVQTPPIVIRGQFAIAATHVG